MKILNILIITVLVITLTATAAYAGPVDWLKSLGKNITGEVIALLLTGILGLIGGGGIVWVKVNRTIKELGEFMMKIGSALEDKRLTKDEVADIYREYKDVVNVWK